jgi:hypothetical protein
VFGISLVTALAISTKVERALLTPVPPADPPVADPTQIGAELRAVRAHLCELDAVGRDLEELEQILDDACARIEEWIA